MTAELVQHFVGMQSSPQTRQMYASDLRDLESFLVGRDVALLSTHEADGLAWRTLLESRRLAPATISRKLTVARSFFEFLLDSDDAGQGTLHRNPFRRVRPPRFDRSVGKTPCPPREEVERLLQRIDPATPRGARDRAIMLLLFNQGLRVSEVARLQRPSIQQHGEHTLLSLVGKGGSEIRSVLAPRVKTALETHLRINAPQGLFVFQALGKRFPGVRPSITPRSIHSSLKRFARLAGLDPRGVRPHSGRVFFITQAYLKSRDLERVATAVGHRNLATTRRYLRYQDILGSHPALLIDLGDDAH